MNWGSHILVNAHLIWKREAIIVVASLVIHLMGTNCNEPFVIVLWNNVRWNMYDGNLDIGKDATDDNIGEDVIDDIDKI